MFLKKKKKKKNIISNISLLLNYTYIKMKIISNKIKITFQKQHKQCMFLITLLYKKKNMVSYRLYNYKVIYLVNYYKTYVDIMRSLFFQKRLVKLENRTEIL